MKNKKARYNLKNKRTVEVEERNYARWELAKKVLLALGGGALLLSVLVAPGAAKILKIFDLEKASQEERRKRWLKIKRTIERLKKNRLVAMYEKDGEWAVELTNAGKTRLLKYQLENLEIKRPKHWDHKWRVIIFDIPEKHKRAREALRRMFNKLGFYPVQKSVFITPYPCRDEVDFVTEIFNVGNFVNYFEASYYDDIAKLELKFPDLFL